MSDTVAPVSTEVLADGVAVLRLTRPPVNALNPRMLVAIHEALDALEDRDEVRAVVVAGEGKVLSAGMDLKELQSFGLDEQCQMVDGLNRSFGRLYGFPKPVICAAHGAAIAGGLFFVLASDYVVAGERARFGLAEMRVGVEFPVGPMALARAELTPPARRRLMLGGGTHGAAEALAMGVVDEVLPGEAVMERALAVAGEYSSLPPRTYAATKTSLREHTLTLIETALTEATQAQRRAWFSEETMVATRAMLESLGEGR